MPGYSTVVVSLKEPGRTPGDASSEAMELVADLAERYQPQRGARQLHAEF